VHRRRWNYRGGEIAGAISEIEVMLDYYLIARLRRLRVAAAN
jgi:hypothetical protein